MRAPSIVFKDLDPCFEAIEGADGELNVIIESLIVSHGHISQVKQSCRLGLLAEVRACNDLDQCLSQKVHCLLICDLIVEADHVF